MWKFLTNFLHYFTKKKGCRQVKYTDDELYQILSVIELTKIPINFLYLLKICFK